MPKFIVRVSRELIGNGEVYVEAKSEEDLRERSKLIKDYADEAVDWEPEDVWHGSDAISIDSIAEMTNPHDEVDVYLAKTIVEDKVEYEIWAGILEEKKKKKEQAPLPGQMGIPGVAEDIPNEPQEETS